MPRPQVLQPRSHKETGLGLDPFRSPLLRTSRLISLPPGTEMFQFPGFASSYEDDGQSPAGLPHSAISGSPRVCHSPELLAAYHGLHRLCVPRHPPHAFLRLTTIDVFKQNYAHCFKRVTFSCENVISIKDSINPTIYHVHPLSNSKDPHFSAENGVKQSRVGDQNVSRRSDYEMLSPPRRLLAIR